MLLRLNHVALERSRSIFHAEFIFGNVDFSAVGMRCVGAVIVRGRHSKAEIINGFRVGAFDGNLKHVVLGRIFRRTVLVVFVRYRILSAVHGNFRSRRGVPQRNDTFDVGIYQRSGIAHRIAQHDFLCFRGKFRGQRTRGTPYLQHVVQLVGNFIGVYAVNRLFFRIVRTHFAVEARNFQLIVSALYLLVLGGDIAFGKEEFEYVVGKQVFPFAVRHRGKVVRFFRRLEIRFQFFFKGL